MVIPIAINTTAKPMLKNKIKVIPNTSLWVAIAISRTTIAAGQGTMPPVIPKTSRSHHVAP